MLFRAGNVSPTIKIPTNNHWTACNYNQMRNLVTAFTEELSQQRQPLSQSLADIQSTSRLLKPFDIKISKALGLVHKKILLAHKIATINQWTAHFTTRVLSTLAGDQWFFALPSEKFNATATIW
ncbi:hypothetical protein [Halioxenophilus sp. WMMB6]|uniref:hypothetical protein n=1 Tax=Halioxenophilus sp. WMMB6 TaxID=3073815 RepID=UPI00295E86D1|nr:hypothetical protein [Halioxenophilus sp. WMMB6]